MIPNNSSTIPFIPHQKPFEKRARIEQSSNSKNLLHLNSLIQKILPNFPELKGSIEESKPLIDIALINITLNPNIAFGENDVLALLHELHQNGFDLNRPFVYTSHYQETPPISQNTSYWRICQDFISHMYGLYRSQIGHYKIVENSVPNSAPPNLGFNLLMTASRSRHTHLLKLLLQHYQNFALDLNYRDSFGFTAAFTVYGTCTSLLIENPDVDIKIKNLFGQGLVHCLVTSNSQEETILKPLKQLIAKNVPLFELDFFQFDPPTYAILNKKYEMVKILLEQLGYDYNRTYQLKGGHHPIKILPYACRLPDPSQEIIEYLLQDPNIDPNELSADQMTPLGHACITGNQKVVQSLLKNPRVDRSALIPFATLNGKIYSSVTPLFIACALNHLPIVNQLTSISGITPNHKDSNGQTPLHIACIQGNIAVVTKLLSLIRTSPNITDAQNCSPLQYAWHYKHREIVRLLLEHPLIDPPPIFHNEPILTCACRLGWNKAVENLLKRQAIDPNLPFNNLTSVGYTLLNGKLETLKLLFKNDRVEKQIATAQPNDKDLQTVTSMLLFYTLEDHDLAPYANAILKDSATHQYTFTPDLFFHYLYAKVTRSTTNLFSEESLSYLETLNLKSQRGESNLIDRIKTSIFSNPYLLSTNLKPPLRFKKTSNPHQEEVELCNQEIKNEKILQYKSEFINFFQQITNETFQFKKHNLLVTLEQLETENLSSQKEKNNLDKFFWPHAFYLLEHFKKLSPNHQQEFIKDSINEIQRANEKCNEGRLYLIEILSENMYFFHSSIRDGAQKATSVEPSRKKTDLKENVAWEHIQKCYSNTIVKLCQEFTTNRFRRDQAPLGNEIHYQNELRDLIDFWDTGDKSMPRTKNDFYSKKKRIQDIVSFIQDPSTLKKIINTTWEKLISDKQTLEELSNSPIWTTFRQQIEEKTLPDHVPLKKEIEENWNLDGYYGSGLSLAKHFIPVCLLALEFPYTFEPLPSPFETQS